MDFGPSGINRLLAWMQEEVNWKIKGFRNV